MRCIKNVHFRISDAEYQGLKSKAAHSGAKSISAYLRNLVKNDSLGIRQSKDILKLQETISDLSIQFRKNSRAVNHMLVLLLSYFVTDDPTEEGYKKARSFFESKFSSV